MPTKPDRSRIEHVKIAKIAVEFSNGDTMYLNTDFSVEVPPVMWPRQVKLLNTLTQLRRDFDGGN